MVICGSPATLAVIALFVEPAAAGAVGSAQPQEPQDGDTSLSQQAALFEQMLAPPWRAQNENGLVNGVVSIDIN